MNKFHQTMNHIELFAGCGGLCLGLSKAGFKLTLANELSPMASETFAFNILGEKLQNATVPGHTLWLSSQYDRSEMAKRLREDPRVFSQVFGQNCELDPTGKNLKKSLIVGSIVDLNKWLTEHPEALENIKNAFGQGEVDLVSGGPPCQSFSLAGLREKNNEKNTLPWEFAKFSSLVRPKCVLLENVTGILRPFTEGGQKYYAWFEIAKAFASIGYVPLTLHINAKFAGVAQNRPRFILLALRKDIFQKLKPTFNQAEQYLFNSSETFFEALERGETVSLGDLTVHDLNTNTANEFDHFDHSFLAPLAVCKTKSDFVTVKDAIQDLEVDGNLPMSDYVRKINSLFVSELKASKEGNDWSHKFTRTTDLVRRRFCIYQRMTSFSDITNREMSHIISGKADFLGDAAWDEAKLALFLREDNTYKRFNSKTEFELFLIAHRTKKQTQRALKACDPAPAALSIPDDACHYSEVRTLSPREMARIQSFPDDFIFCSKTTTGGQNRRFEVPIYTQIGNAVPVLLGYALGKAVHKLLSRL